MVVRRPQSDSVAPEPLFVVGAVSQYLGAAVAVHLFDETAPAGVALVRVLGAAVMIILLRRSWQRRWKASDLAWASAFGMTLAAMNLSIYLSIDELPLGNAVAIEFTGPILVAAAFTRTLRSGTALLLAAGGVVVLAGVEAEGTMRGVGFALLAGMFWAGYIVLGHRVARGPAAVDGLGLGMLAGAAAISGFGAPELGPAFDTPKVLLLALVTGLLSNVVPYWIDQVVMRRITQHRFALLQALLPVTAVLVGLVVLIQVPSVREMLGIALVIAAILLSRSAKGPGGTAAGVGLRTAD
ncbi:MAG: EamA family transporter [Acidimicrobiia bacterium]|nr:EamA family transporter [Acidimicrobiia bacterium]MYG59460.1 EamA family transporter [Acidimicrobiia bacterium]MYH95291.1 EamA family transporter [Acidimicrobiia bacterium]MYJ31208.1 EamA family transporter [Acidimicrobiia bacterium]